MTRSKQPKFPAHPLKSIKLQNILSFGPEGMELELKPLNVLIGANASGKSTLLEAIALIKSLPTDPHTLVKEGGGMEEWAWKGPPKAHHYEMPRVEVVLENPLGDADLGYSFRLSPSGEPPLFAQEQLRDAKQGEKGRSHFHIDDFDLVTPF